MTSGTSAWLPFSRVMDLKKEAEMQIHRLHLNGWNYDLWHEPGGGTKPSTRSGLGLQKGEPFAADIRTRHDTHLRMVIRPENVWAWAFYSVDDSAEDYSSGL